MIALLGCGGGGDSGGSCNMPAGCGGDIVGTWKVTSSCVTTSGSIGEMDCPQATASFSNYRVDGTDTYRSDMTFTAALSFSFDYAITLPASCLTTQGITITCAQLQVAVRAEPNSNLPGVSCAAAGSGCTCTGKLEGSEQMGTGTWSTAGTVLTETDSGGQPQLSDYCVRGNTLQVMPHMDMTMPTMGTISASGSITLTKQ